MFVFDSMSIFASSPGLNWFLKEPKLSVKSMNNSVFIISKYELLVPDFPLAVALTLRKYSPSTREAGI